MKTSIDNLNKVIWTYSPFIEYLENSKPENIQFLCAKLNNDFEFQNNCHRAIGEITLLYDNNKKELIEKYYNIFKNLNQRLLKWQSEKLENRFYLNYINLALGESGVYEIYKDLKNYYSKYYENEAKRIFDKINNYKKNESIFRVLSDLIDEKHNLTSFLNPNPDVSLFYYELFSFLDFENIKLRYGNNEFSQNFVDLFNYLENVLKCRVNNLLYDYQVKINNLPNEQIKNDKKSFIKSIGLIKLDTIKLEEKQNTFQHYYLSMIEYYNQNNNYKSLSEINLIHFILTFNEYFMFELLNKFEIILESLNSLENPNPKTETTTKKKPELTQIWLSEPKITVDNFLKLGIEKGIWNEQYNIITRKGSLYGTGKSLLGNLSIALKGYAISNNTDYKEVGKAFCNTFNIPIKETIKEPYKAFNSGNGKQIREFKKAFNIK